MQCDSCGAEIEGGARFCPACGQPAAAERAGNLAEPGPAPAMASALPGPDPAMASALPLPSLNDPRLLDGARQMGWNWGGFLLPYLWLMGHGRLTPGLLLALSTVIPVVGWLNFLVYPMVGIYLGLNGYEQAWRHQPYHGLDQLQAREREWSVWGFVGVILFLVGIAFFMAFLAPMYQEALQNMGDYGW